MKFQQRHGGARLTGLGLALDFDQSHIHHAQNLRVLGGVLAEQDTFVFHLIKPVTLRQGCQD